MSRGPAPEGREGEDERPPPVLGAWRNLYLIEGLVLVALIALFLWLGERYR